MSSVCTSVCSHLWTFTFNILLREKFSNLIYGNATSYSVLLCAFSHMAFNVRPKLWASENRRAHQSQIIHNDRLLIEQQNGNGYLLISQVGPLHPVAHAQVNSLTGGVGDSTDDTFAVLLNSTLLDSLVGRTLTGLPIELMPRIPRRTTTAVVCSSVLSLSLRPLPSYFDGFCKMKYKKSNHFENHR